MKINIDLIYPIGAVYISTNTINPSTLFGGEWRQIKDTFLLACGDTYANGSTGGEAEHTLTAEEMPSHNHDYARSRLFFSEPSGQNAIGYGNNSGTAITATTKNSGGNQSHNNMPPYLTVCVWERIG